MQLSILHRTTYRFSSPVMNVVQLLRLTPLSCLTQTVLEWRIDVNCDARLRETLDGYGNCVHMLYVDEPAEEIVITASGRVITEDKAGVIQGVPNDLPQELFLRPTSLTNPEGQLAALADQVRETRGGPLAVLHALNSTVQKQMTFEAGATDAGTTAAIAYAARRGVCQDFAHIFIATARLCGIPARYVSGHLFRRDAVGPQEAGHAWAEAWLPDLGWIAFDPTHGICADDSYIRIATGIDYREASPMAGVRLGGGTESMSVEVLVSEPAPRSRRQSQRQTQSNGKQTQSQSQRRGT